MLTNGTSQLHKQINKTEVSQGTVLMVKLKRNDTLHCLYQFSQLDEQWLTFERGAHIRDLNKFR